MPNRLINATSPYLLQHADNPVDWHEWGEEAFEVARESDRPILLSVGYAACHWCHVMAHESFEDETTAEYMNKYFVNVKVDREERPDVDRIYMDAVQAMTGRGGWPMTVFLTPDGRPFYAGTYYPKEPHGHHPTFMQILSALNAAWHEQRADVDEQADKLTTAVQAQLPESPEPPSKEVVSQAVAKLEGNFDPVRGGFGGAPKFPQVPTLELLLRVAAVWHDDGVRQRAMEMLTKTLDAMASGGIYDHLYGGFARYSVDADWLVPHFEKMLYDNALLARLYTQAWQLTGDDEYKRVARETLDYLARDMRHPEGGIFSAQDADSEGEEGKFAVWSASEFAEVTGEDASLMAAIYGVSPSGNFEGNNVLERYRPLAEIRGEFSIGAEELAARRSRGDAKLVARRQTRVPPAIDDKVVLAWNGLAMRAFADAAAAFDDPEYLEVAVGIAQFVAGPGMTDQGRLIRAWRNGRVSGPGFCDDYAAVAIGLIALYQAGGDERWYQLSIDLIDEMLRLFADEKGGGFFATGSDTPDLIARPKNLMDNPTPADNSLAAEALVLRHALTGESGLLDHVERIIACAGVLLTRHPAAGGHLLAVLATQPMHQVALVVEPGTGAEDLITTFRGQYRPRHVLAVGVPGSAVPLLEGRTPVDGRTTAYVCESFVCKLPTSSAAEFSGLLRVAGPEMPGGLPNPA